MIERAETLRQAGADTIEGAPARSVGLIQIGTARVALPVESIREVVQGLPFYGALPVKADGLLGAIDIRGTIVPVVDLRPAFGWAADENEGHVVVIMRCDGHLLGLRAEAVFGIMQLQPGDLCDLNAAGPQPSDMLATHAFKNNDAIVTILDPGRIADRPGLPKVLEKAERRELASAASETVLLFSHGRAHLGIDADCVDAAVPDVRIEKNAMTTGFCLGTIEHRGYIVPVVDTTAAVGLGTGPRTSTCPVIVIRFGAKTMLGLAVDAVRDIVPIASAAILPMPALSWDGASFFRGMLLGKEEPRHLLIDLGHFRRDSELIDLAQLCRPQPRLQVGDGGRERNVAHDRAERYMIYKAGGDVATRLAQITEVLPFPTDVAPLVSTDRGILGLFVHRRRLVPLVCLQRVLTGRDWEVNKDTARVLFVEAGDRHAAFVVEDLVSIETAHADQFSAARENALMGVPFVMLGVERRMVSHVDLARQIEDAYCVTVADPDAGHAGDVTPMQASA